MREVSFVASGIVKSFNDAKGPDATKVAPIASIA